jgi:hypothetical protein
MASEKERRKRRAVEQKLKRPTASKLPKDGDRRHRGADTARQAQERKRAERAWTIDSLPGGFFNPGNENPPG